LAGIVHGAGVPVAAGFIEVLHHAADLGIAILRGAGFAVVAIYGRTLAVSVTILPVAYVHGAGVPVVAVPVIHAEGRAFRALFMHTALGWVAGVEGAVTPVIAAHGQVRAGVVLFMIAEVLRARVLVVAIGIGFAVETDVQVEATQGRLAEVRGARVPVIAVDFPVDTHARVPFTQVVCAGILVVALLDRGAGPASGQVLVGALTVGGIAGVLGTRVLVITVHGLDHAFRGHTPTAAHGFLARGRFAGVFREAVIVGEAGGNAYAVEFAKALVQAHIVGAPVTVVALTGGLTVHAIVDQGNVEADLVRTLVRGASVPVATVIIVFAGLAPGKLLVRAVAIGAGVLGARIAVVAIRGLVALLAGIYRHVHGGLVPTRIHRRPIHATARVHRIIAVRDRDVGKGDGVQAGRRSVITGPEARGEEGQGKNQTH